MTLKLTTCPAKYYDVLVRLANDCDIGLAFIIRDNVLYLKGNYNGYIYTFKTLDKRLYSLMELVCSMIETIMCEHQNIFKNNIFKSILDFIYDLKNDLNILQNDKENISLLFR